MIYQGWYHTVVKMLVLKPTHVSVLFLLIKKKYSYIGLLEIGNEKSSVYSDIFL